MENIVVQAYRMAKYKDLFTITQILEKLLRQNRAGVKSCHDVTIRQVRDILQRRRLEYTVQ